MLSLMPSGAIPLNVYRLLANQVGLALTLEPHPARFFNPQLAPPLINTLSQKLELLGSNGLDAVIVEPFDRAYAALAPEEFVEQVLVKRLGVSHVIVGTDFSFGRQRAGNLKTLRKLGEHHAFSTEAIEPVSAGGIVVSSSKIREFLLLGRVEGAATLLGRPFFIEGRVVRGDGRGRQFGIPTANLEPFNELIPGRGVYGGWMTIAGGLRYPAAINVGQAPTVAKRTTNTVEAHALDFSADLLGQEIRIEFVHHLRDEKRFSGVDQLISAIHQDIERVRKLTASESKT